MRSDIDSLILRIYDAALKPENWQSVLQDIQTLCGAHQATLFFFDANNKNRCFASAAKANPEAIQYFLDNHINAQAISLTETLYHLPIGKVITQTDFWSLSGKKYEDWVGDDYMNRAWPNLTFQAGIILYRNDNICAGFGLQNVRDTTLISDAGINTLHFLALHLTQAITMYELAFKLEKHHQSLYKLTNYLPQSIGLDNLCIKLKLPFAYFNSTYNLTPAETELLELLINGNNLKQASQLRNTKLETNRTQVKSILKKTQTHSQEELLKLALGLCD
jgi:DNA-binding CsgD family transcriptional regulator